MVSRFCASLWVTKIYYSYIVMQKTSDLFVKCLEAHEVEYIFGVPGEENLDLLESLRTSSIQLIVTRNEQTAVFMAATYGRLTGKTWVALATLWPGATNMMTGVAYAQLWWMPVLVITGQKPIKHSKQGKFQVIDVVWMMKPVTKYSTVIVDGARVPSLLAHAFVTAEDEKPGAVHLELPEDIAWEMIDDEFAPIVTQKIRRPIVDDKALQQLIKKLTSAKQPLLLIWAGANRKRITTYLSKFVETTNIPFFTSQMWKGVLDERLPQYIGTAALTSGDHLHEAIQQADLILAIGHDTIEKPTNIIHDGETELVHINFSEAEFDELYKPTLQVIWDIGNTMRQLTEANIDVSGWDFTKIYDTAIQAKKKLADFQKSHYDHEVMMPGRLIWELRNILNEDDIIALDNGLYKVRFARNFPCYKPNTLILDNALATMWAWYSSAMMAKILNPTQKVVAVVWDGGLVMNLWDLETAVTLWNDLTIIVLNDNAYGMIKRKQINHDYHDFALDLRNPDFVKLAEAFGAHGYLLDDPNTFTDRMTEIIATPWVNIVEVPFAYPDKIE